MTSVFKKMAQTLAVVGFLLLILPLTASAQMTIQGSGGDERPYYVGLPKIEGDEVSASGSLQSILEEDFLLSGLVTAVGTAEESVIINERTPNIATMAPWAVRKTDFLVVAAISIPNPGSNRRHLRLRIFDTVRNTELRGIQIAFDIRQVAVAAHQVADIVIERITGVRVGLSQLVAFVVKQGKNSYILRVSDILGKNSQTLLSSRNPIISPTWSPDGLRIAYTSFELGTPQVFTQEIATGNRLKLSNSYSSTSSPAWSPDGSRLAFSAYLDGKTSLYEYNFATKQTTLITSEGNINTEPVYAADGTIFYSSSRGSSPQIYRFNPATGQSDRITFGDEYCLKPSIATRLPILAYLVRQGDGVKILDLAKKETHSLAMSAPADSVSISPYGRLLLVTVVNKRRNSIIITNTKGTYRRELDGGGSNFYEPAWRP